MFPFIILGLVGGLMMAGLMFFYFSFVTANFEKFPRIVWALSNAIYILCIVCFVFLPLSNFCTVQILKQNSKDVLSNLRIFWLIPFLLFGFFGIYKLEKKQEEIRKAKRS